MAEHDFGALYEQYPAIIEQMPETFDSHAFILRLAHEHQVLYVEALYSYRDSMHRGQPTPFRAVHHILSQHLSACPDQVRRVDHTTSADIFGQAEGCVLWKKV